MENIEMRTHNFVIQLWMLHMVHIFIFCAVGWFYEMWYAVILCHDNLPHHMVRLHLLLFVDYMRYLLKWCDASPTSSFHIIKQKASQHTHIAPSSIQYSREPGLKSKVETGLAYFMRTCMFYHFKIFVLAVSYFALRRMWLACDLIAVQCKAVVSKVWII